VVEKTLRASARYQRTMLGKEKTMTCLALVGGLAFIGGLSE
jgi:hypothetical protein